MAVTTSAPRPGRKVRVVEARLHLADGPADDRSTVARATLQQIRRAPVELPDDLDEHSPDEVAPPPPEELEPAPNMIDAAAGVRFHSHAVEHRSPAPFFGLPGPALDWIRVAVDLLPGVTLSPLARVAAAADFGNGISGVLPFGEYLFVNPDLNVALTRLPVDEWVCLDAVTRLGEEGTGLATCIVRDRHGRLGVSAQTLLIDRT